MTLQRVLQEYPQATPGPFADHPTAEFIRRDLAAAVDRIVDDESFLVTASAGQSRWAETPWVAVFDRLVTESAQCGYYIVYLFRGDGEGVFLSLNQGTTEVLNRVGREHYLEVLRFQGAKFVQRLTPALVNNLHVGPLDLRGHGDLTRGYSAGNIAAIYYRPLDLTNDERLQRDLNRLLHLYRVLVDSDGGDPSGTSGTDANVTTAIETAKYRMHRRVEGNRWLANKAKKLHGLICKVCKMSFEARYGQIGKGYIEAHYLKPFRKSGGRPTELDARKDFTVVCSNCHRMLHRTDPAIAPDELASMMRPWPSTP
jgi:5-methylcytosine-specific restriction protein A